MKAKLTKSIDLKILEIIQSLFFKYIRIEQKNGSRQGIPKYLETEQQMPK